MYNQEFKEIMEHPFVKQVDEEIVTIRKRLHTAIDRSVPDYVSISANAEHLVKRIQDRDKFIGQLVRTEWKRQVTNHYYSNATEMCPPEMPS